MKEQGMKNDFRYFVLFLLLFVFYESFSQTNIQSMRFHYKDGTTYDISIASIDSITFEEVIEQPSITHYVESNEVLARAYKMATMEWIPIGPIPKRGSGYYPSNTTVVGASYSSVKEINTYLFQDVTKVFFTGFMNDMNDVEVKHLQLYPNPVDQYFIIIGLEVGEHQLSVFSMNGVEIIRKE